MWLPDAKATTMVAHWLLLCASAVGIAHAQPEIKWRTVGGRELRAIFVDHELADGVHYAYRFRPDGAFTGYEMARDVRGQWRTADGELCWTWIRPRGSEECFVIQRRGAEVRLLRDGNEFLSGTLTPIKRAPASKESR